MSEHDDVGPVVRLRPSASGFIWPVIWITGMTAFVIGLLVDGEGGGVGEALFAAGSTLVVIVVPAVRTVRAAQTCVFSVGTELHLRAGSSTRIIPAADIDGFVWVDQVGRRIVMTDKRWLPWESVAIAMRPGSPSLLAWDRRHSMRLARMFGNHRGRSDLALSFVPKRRTRRAFDDLEAWHRWASRDTTSPRPAAVRRCG